MNSLPIQKTILVVEDEFLVAIDIADILTGLGYRVVTARSAEERGAAGSYDAVLLDHGLSGEGSARLADLLLETGVPFAFCTGLAAEELRVRYPGVPTIEKPFQPETLAAVAKAFFETAHLPPAPNRAQADPRGAL